MISISAVRLSKQAKAVLESIASGPVPGVQLNISGIAQLVDLGYAEKFRLPNPFPRRGANKTLEHIRITADGSKRLAELKESAT